MLLAEYFKDTLAESKLNVNCLKSEWHSFKRMISQNYSSVKISLWIWQRLITYRESEFKNVRLIAKICLCIGTSNSTVEQGFSLLSSIFTDRRMKISKKVTQNCLLIAATTKNLAETEDRD